jgi:spore coat polysaccharide biosynthesis protein SpsF
MASPRVVTGVFLQARLGSTRLPSKALLELEGITVIAHVMRALRDIKADVHALLTDTASADAFRPLAVKAGFQLFMGPANDVLARFCLAADHFGVRRIVRATGDNPLVSAELANYNLRLHEKLGADLSRLRGAPLGTGVEVVEALALQAANMLSTDSYEHEHITTYLLRRGEHYKVFEIPCPRFFLLPAAHVTLDTEEDYVVLKKIFAALYRGKPINALRLIRWLKKNPLP